MLTNKKKFNIPIFIPDYGCPFQCIFCNQKTITQTRNIPTKEEVSIKISNYLNTINYIDNEVEIAFFGGNFTGLSCKIQEEFLTIANNFIKNGFVKSIRISTRPDAINIENLELLKHYSVKSIELGAQSFDKKVLEQSGRGHTAEQTIDSAKLIIKNKFTLGLQMMLGLPSDTFEKSFESAKKIIELKANETRIYPVLVIKNTILEALFNKKQYTPLSLNEAIMWSVPIYELFRKTQTKILKIGLHPSDELENGSQLVAGPYHKSFRYLMMSFLWKQKFLKIPKNSNKIIIKLNPKDINYAIGYKKENLLFLKTLFSSVSFVQDNNIEIEKFYVDFL